MTVVFQAFQKWQDGEEGLTDAQVAAKLKVNPSTIWRAKRGLRELSMRHQIALQKLTGISPSEWADFYALTVHLRGKDAVPTQKKSAVTDAERAA